MRRPNRQARSTTRVQCDRVSPSRSPSVSARTSTVAERTSSEGGASAGWPIEPRFRRGPALPFPRPSERASHSAGRGRVSTPAPLPVRNQAVARELALRLLEGEVPRRQDHVRLHQLVLGQLVAVGQHQLEHLVPQLPEAGLVALLDGRHRAIVQLVQPFLVGVGQPELPLARNADDHQADPSFSPSPRAGASEPLPSSAFILASSSSTWAPAPICASSRSMSSWPAPSW